jgi:hypothetical protein
MDEFKTEELGSIGQYIKNVLTKNLEMWPRVEGNGESKKGKDPATEDIYSIFSDTRIKEIEEITGYKLPTWGRKSETNPFNGQYYGIDKDFKQVAVGIRWGESYASFSKAKQTRTKDKNINKMQLLVTSSVYKETIKNENLTISAGDGKRYNPEKMAKYFKEHPVQIIPLCLEIPIIGGNGRQILILETRKDVWNTTKSMYFKEEDNEYREEQFTLNQEMNDNFRRCIDELLDEGEL